MFFLKKNFYSSLTICREATRKLYVCFGAAYKDVIIVMTNPHTPISNSPQKTRLRLLSMVILNNNLKQNRKYQKKTYFTLLLQLLYL